MGNAFSNSVWETAAAFMRVDQFYWNPYGLPFLMASLFALWMGGYVFAHGGAFYQRLSFLTVALSFSFWLGGTFLFYSVANEAIIMIPLAVTWIGVLLIGPTLLWYISVWVGQIRENKTKIVLGFVFAGVLYTLIIGTDWVVPGVTRYPWGYHSKLSLPGGIGVLGFLAGYLYLMYRTLLRGYKKETHWLGRKQILLVFGALIIANLGCSDFLPCYGINVPPLGGLAFFMTLCVLAYTIIQYKLFDIETVIHKTVMWFMTTVVAILPFVYIGYKTHGWFQGQEAYGATAYLAALMIAFYFYFRTLQPKLDQLFRRRHANLQGALNRFSEELVHLAKLDELLARFMRTLHESLYVRDASIYLRDASRELFIPVKMMGIRDLEPIRADEPFLQRLEAHDAVAVWDLARTHPAFEGIRESMNGYFKTVQAQVAVPLVLGGKMIGVVHLGKKDNLKRVSSAEVHFLSQMRLPFTIAISNSRQFENVSDLYRQVQIQNERLKELDRLKSEFLANTSHELRTPLNGILGLVEAILDGADGPINPGQGRHLRMIIESGTNLKELINNLLELSRIESGQEVFEIRRFNLCNVFDAVGVLLEGLAAKKKIEIRRVIDETLPDVYGDPVKIQRVITNLMGNAIKFTEEGSVTIRAEETPEAVRISIEDTGIGITEDQQEVIFERFRQADGGTTRRYEGTGLGLSISREIVRMHGSDIRVKSEPGRGSTFSFTLSKTPFVMPDQTGSQGSVRSNPKRPEDAKSLIGAEPVLAYGEDREYELEKDEDFRKAVQGEGELVLIIDDNEVNREVIKTQLTMNQYRVTEAVDGIEGLECLARQKPDLVILDLMMPRMSGYEFCRKLRLRHSPDELPVIMLTAKTEMGDKVYGLKLGANDYISKPFHKEELIARVGVLLKIRKMTHELRRWNEVLEHRGDERSKELAKAQEQLIQAEKLATLGTLAGGIAHEINNPLTAVLTNAQILKMDAGKEDLPLLSLIEEGAKRCQLIIQKLMKYARKVPEQALTEQVDVAKVVKNVEAFLGYQLSQENIELAVPENLPDLQVTGHANELEQVLTNLILNGKDAILQARKAGRITVALKEKDLWVLLEVTDNGIGIPEENLKKIFDPFFTTKEVGKGTGLGLAVTYGIIERHGGRVEVSSDFGKGAAFRVLLPRAKTKGASKKVKEKADTGASKRP